MAEHGSFVQTFPSLQFRGGPPTQSPLMHMSFVVQMFASVQGPAAGVPPWQIPALHVSPLVQTFPSSHGPVS